MAHEHLAEFLGAPRGGGCSWGRAQEKTAVFRTEKRRDANGDSYPWIVKTTGLVNHFYFYCYDDDFGPFFLKFCSYFPYNAKLCINGNHWAQPRPGRQGRHCVRAVGQRVRRGRRPGRCCRRSATAWDRRRSTRCCASGWRSFPHPFTRFRRPRRRLPLRHLDPAGRVLPDPDARPAGVGRVFEQVIRDNLDIGRPDQVEPDLDRRKIVNGRKHKTPGRFRTRVITCGVTPSLHVDYKHTTIKQYHKEGRALRTETTINDTRDFGIGKRLTNLPALREIGSTANRRLLHVQRLSHDPITGTDALAAITGTVTTATGARVPGLRFADRRSHALLSALLVFRQHPNGFTNKDLRALTTELRGLDPDSVSAGQITYDLRRLRTRALIARVPHSHRYTVTDEGLDTAKFLTCVHDRVLRSGLAELATPTPTPGRLRCAATAYRRAIDTLHRLAAQTRGERSRTDRITHT